MRTACSLPYGGSPGQKPPGHRSPCTETTLDRDPSLDRDWDPPPVDRRQTGKHYLPATSFAGGNNPSGFLSFSEIFLFDDFNVKTTYIYTLLIYMLYYSFVNDIQTGRLMSKCLFTAHKRSLWQGNIFTSVCPQREGVFLTETPPLRTETPRQRPSRQRPPWIETPLYGKEQAVHILLECILVTLVLSVFPDGLLQWFTNTYIM